MLADDYDVTVDYDGPSWFVYIRPKPWLVTATAEAILHELTVYNRDDLLRKLVGDPAMFDRITDRMATILPGAVDVVTTGGRPAPLFTHHGMPGGAWEPVAEPPYCYSHTCPNHVESADLYCDDCTQEFVEAQRREDAAEVRRMIG